MNPGIQALLIICLTIIALSFLGSRNNKNKK